MQDINGVMISERTASYLTTALWSSVNDDGEPLDSHYELDSCSPDMLQRAEKDVSEWFALLEKSDLYELAIEQTDDGHIAHDLWLTRNGHGAGYWDGDYGDDGLGDELTTLCKDLGELHIWINESGMLSFE